MTYKKVEVPDDFKIKVGERLRLARDGAGLSQEQMGVKVGQSGKTIGSWEKGTTSPRVTDMKKISEVTKKSLAWLLAIEKPAPQKEERAAVNEDAGGYDPTGSGRLVDPIRMPPEETTKMLTGYFDFGDRVIRASLLLEAYGPPSRFGGYSSDEPRIDE